MTGTTRIELMREADRLLALNGFSADGRPRDERSPRQFFFEARAVRTPTGGKPGRRRRSKHS